MKRAVEFLSLAPCIRATDISMFIMSMMTAATAVCLKSEEPNE
jgi:hypothetical protein